MNALKNYFLCNHRMNRKPYFSICMLCALVLLPISLYFLAGINPADVQAVADLSHQLSSGKISQAAYDSQSQEIGTRLAAQMAPSIILGFIASLLLLPTQIMRLKDLDTPLKLLISIVVFTTFVWSGISEKILPHLVYQALTLIALVVALVLTFKRGTIGDNRYGPDPLEGVVVVETRWLLMLGLAVGAIVVIISFIVFNSMAPK